MLRNFSEPKSAELWKSAEFQERCVCDETHLRNSSRHRVVAVVQLEKRDETIIVVVHSVHRPRTSATGSGQWVTSSLLISTAYLYTPRAAHAIKGTEDW